MSPRFLSKHRYAILFVSFAAAIILLLVVFVSSYSKIYPKTTALIPSPTTAPNQVTLDGDVVCLPHKDTSGPQTLECAIGLLDQNGVFYALDTNQSSVTPPQFTTGDKIRVSGVLTPLEVLSTDYWFKYNILGIIRVTNLQVL